VAPPPASGPLTERRVYGIMYGMNKTTVYLPENRKAALERLADRERSEARPLPADSRLVSS
jgi:hypothetical protein